MFTTKTVDSITKNLSKMVSQLAQHAKDMTARADAFDAEITKMQADRDTALVERTRALAAAEKIEALLA